MVIRTMEITKDSKQFFFAFFSRNILGTFSNLNFLDLLMTPVVGFMIDYGFKPLLVILTKSVCIILDDNIQCFNRSTRQQLDASTRQWDFTSDFFGFDFLTFCTQVLSSS